MNQPQSIEVSAPDVQSAIEKGIAELGVSRDQVMVEVLEEPSRGLLGLGAKLARVKLTAIRAPETPAAPAPSSTSASTPAAQTSAPATASEQPAPAQNRAERFERSEPRERDQQRDQRPQRDRGDRSDRERRPYQPQQPARRPYADLDEDFDENEIVAATPEEMAEDARVGLDILRTILKNMQIRASVSTRQAQTSEGEAQHWVLDISGSDLGLLIGRKGETLAALQYITRLIASRQLGRRANIVIDVEGYKARRETMLFRLAKRMADQAIQRGRTVQLEPMPPHERRIIHMALRENPDVTTESIGEGDKRKVTIVPKKMH
ncbi:MAG: Jag N-terminal domain-containing protein [Anaerolineae bacterium]|nr:Jag N-terminal domain-containing protein [Anaerolineae bacterium]